MDERSGSQSDPGQTQSDAGTTGGARTPADTTQVPGTGQGAKDSTRAPETKQQTPPERK